MSKINVMVFEPGKECYIKEIENTLEAMQEIVGGYIETVMLTPHLDDGKSLVLVCNEEGKLLNLPESIKVWGDPIKGTCFICKTAGEEFASLTD